MDVSVNYLAVLVAAIASMVVGFVWYGVLFKKSWMHLMGISQGSQKDMTLSANQAYALQFVASLVMAYVLSLVISWASAYQEAGGLEVGCITAFFIWLGFIVPTSLGIVMWEGKSWKLWFINASHYLVGLVVMGLILAGWQ